MKGSSRMNSKTEKIPTLGIREFHQQFDGEAAFQYHEIRGSRLIDKLHKHDFFMIMVIEKGSGTHTIDFRDYSVKPLQVHLLFPNQVHKWELSKNTMAYQLMISKHIFESFSSSLGVSFVLYQGHPVLNISAAVFKKLHYEFTCIREELNTKPVNWHIINLRSRLVATMVGREADNKFEDLSVYKAMPVLFRYHSLVDQHFREQKTVAFYASRLNITANYLNILCKRHLHVPAMYLIQNRTILEAKRLIQASERSIKEISFDLGFKDPAYFSNFFKTQTGSSPTEFRDQL